MNNLFLKNLFILILLILWQPSFAQSFSDADVQEILKKNPSLLKGVTKEANINDINDNLTSKNQSVTNINNSLKLDLSHSAEGEALNKKSMLTRYYNALTGKDLNVYGSNEFNQSQNDNLLFFNTVGENYQIAPGDIIQITTTGLFSSNRNYQILNDGTIEIENIYPLNVNNLTLKQVSKLVLARILLDDASAEVFVRLNSARLVTVQISGNVKSPRTIAVPAYTPLSRVMAYSGGISENGSLRNIKLSQHGSEIQTVDFYDFLQNPSPKTDPLIKNGARIFVPNKGATVAAFGFVNKPGIYELPNNKLEVSIKNILKISGTSFLPPGAKLKISYIDPNGKIVTRLALKNDTIKEGEALQVDFIETRDLNISKVSGAVLKNYEIKTNSPLSIKEVLKGGSVLSSDAYYQFALIHGKEVHAINLNDALENDNIILPIGSDLRVLDKQEYLSLVAEDPNNSLNPLITQLIKAENIVKIYLDGIKIAYVPVSQKQKGSSFKEVLESGLVTNIEGNLLNNNIFTAFALVIGNDVQAVNLDAAIQDDSISLSAGSDLRLFTHKGYKELVLDDTNETIDPLVYKFNATNVAEIYINGSRIAYIPVGQSKELYETIADFYTLRPKTITDIALIERSNGVEAFDLLEVLNGKAYRNLAHGDKLFIFEGKFYDDLIQSISQNDAMPSAEIVGIQSSSSLETNETSVEALMLRKQIEEEDERYEEKLNYTKRILQQSNLITIKLDGKLFTYLPLEEGLSSYHSLKELQKRFPKIINEFIVVQDLSTGKLPEIKNLNYPFKIKKGEEINFISTESYRLAIKSYDDLNETNLLSELKTSNAVKVYYDGHLVLLLPPNYRPSELKLFEKYTKKSDLYKLYVDVKTTNLANGTWDLLTFGSEAFFSKSNNLLLGPSNIVNLFSNNFIRNEFIYDKVNINGVNFNINAETSKRDEFANTPDVLATDILIPNNDLEEVKITNEISPNVDKLLNSHIKIMKNSLRTISGSVQFPGSYPVAKKIRLSNFLSTAGLIEQTSKSNIIITEAINQKDRLIRANPKTIKLNDKNLSKIELSGLYYLDVPMAINDAVTGIIDLKGEVLIPGNYSFTRSETLQDIIKRAGGLSDVAFPLGAVLERQSAKVLEKESNNILADQLESSILNLAQSSLEGAGDQVKVVLGYATQLRNQPTVGRIALNILEDNPSNPLYLEDGDKLIIPKRPSHVTVVGSVQRSTIASYAQGQNFHDYLEVAGGVTKLADTRKAYLLLPNGESRSLDKSTVIPVGSVIIVPPKLDRLSILGGTDIISRVLSNISNSILSIQNVD